MISSSVQTSTNVSASWQWLGWCGSNHDDVDDHNYICDYYNEEVGNDTETIHALSSRWLFGQGLRVQPWCRRDDDDDWWWEDEDEDEKDDDNAQDGETMPALSSRWGHLGRGAAGQVGKRWRDDVVHKLYQIPNTKHTKYQVPSTKHTKYQAHILYILQVLGGMAYL